MSGAPHSCGCVSQTLVPYLRGRSWSTYDLDIFSTSGLEQDQAHVRMLDQNGHDDQVAGLILGVLVAC